jgi:hypothetical protein
MRLGEMELADCISYMISQAGIVRVGKKLIGIVVVADRAVTALGLGKRTGGAAKPAVSECLVMGQDLAGRFCRVSVKQMVYE